MSAAVDDMPVLLLAVPLLTAAVLAAVGPWLSRVLADCLSLLASMACLAGAVWLASSVGGGRVVQWLGGWDPQSGPPVGIVLVADGIGSGLVVVAAGLTVAALVYSWRFLEDVAASYHVLLLVFLAAMTGFAMAGDVFDAFVWLELMGIAAYALTGLRVEEPRSVQGALVFGILNTLGASFTLLGIAFLYARTGELNLAAMGERLRTGDHPDALVLVSCALLLSGVLVKSAAAPFHFWTADAEAVAPTPVCVLLSGVMVVTGVYGVARWWWLVFDGVVGTDTMRHALLAIGTVTALLGAVMCLAQRHVKRLLAYSTISHVGVFLVGVGLLDESGTAAVALYMVGHACAKGALFMGTGVLLNRFETVDEHALFGRGRGMPVTFAVFVAGALGLAGLVPLGVWPGKVALDDAGLQSGEGWVVLVLMVTSALTGGAVLRTALRVFRGVGPDPRAPEERESVEEPETGSPLGRAPWSMLGPALLLLAVSVAPAFLASVRAGASTAAAAFVDPASYTLAVLAPARQVADAHGVAAEVWTSSGLMTSAASVALAAVVATLGLWWSRVPAAVHRAIRPARRLLDGLHVVHEAHVGSHVAWLVVGVAALGTSMLW
jgi:multicomponent Na+:H+ antiporter subunit D